MELSIYIIFIYLVLVMAIAMALMGLFGSAIAGPRRLPLPQETGKAIRWAKLGIYISSIIPFSKRLLVKLKLEGKIRKNLEAAHLTITPEGYFNLKLIIISLLVILTYLIVGKNEPVMFLLPLILGYILPDFWLKKKVSSRKTTIVRYLPETVDLLGLCVEAGLDFSSALKWITEKITPNPTIEEMAVVAKEIKLGKTRIQALKDMAKRLNIPELNSFVQTLVQAERMGTPVADSFRIISEETRSMRFQRGERLALQAPLKILIPLVFCILPVIAIVVGGPLILQFMQGNLLGGTGF